MSMELMIALRAIENEKKCKKVGGRCPLPKAMRNREEFCVHCIKPKIAAEYKIEKANFWNAIYEKDKTKKAFFQEKMEEIALRIKAYG